mmetsp:Transcript_23016/g.35852  ORF Transcript_23016/g.35852 Transcript_23016/m.35852 type:complete len:102 (+) Transcript_23016:571-876(+)
MIIITVFYYLNKTIYKNEKKKIKFDGKVPGRAPQSNCFLLLVVHEGQDVNDHFRRRPLLGVGSAALCLQIIEWIEFWPRPIWSFCNFVGPLEGQNFPHNNP